jgi:hypothetical protein
MPDDTGIFKEVVIFIKLHSVGSAERNFQAKNFPRFKGASIPTIDMGANRKRFSILKTPVAGGMPSYSKKFLEV